MLLTGTRMGAQAPASQKMPLDSSADPLGGSLRMWIQAQRENEPQEIVAVVRRANPFELQSLRVGAEKPRHPMRRRRPTRYLVHAR